MLSRATPAEWRKGYALHRRRQETDGYGELVNRYDMEHPDLVVEDGGENAVCWQDVRTWQTGGQLSTGNMVKPAGESWQDVLQGALFGGLEVAPFDRFVVDGGIYELRKVQRWPGHRLLLLQRLF